MAAQMHGHHHYKEDDLHDTVHQTPVIPGTGLPVQAEVNLEKPSDRHGPDSLVVEDMTGVPSVVVVEDVIGVSSVGACEFEHGNPPAGTYFVTGEGERVQISPLKGLEEDPHSPKIYPAKNLPSNYQTKVTDPTGQGGEEGKIAPLLERLDKFHLHDDQTQPVPRSVPGLGPHDPTPNLDLPRSFHEAQIESMPRNTVAGQISSAAKDAVASKLGYGSRAQNDDIQSEKKKPAARLAAECGDETAGNLGRFSDKRTGSEAVEGGHRSLSVKEYVAGKLRPGEEDRALSEAILGRFQRKEVGSEDAAAVSGGVGNRMRRAVASWFGKGGNQVN